MRLRDLLWAAPAIALIVIAYLSVRGGRARSRRAKGLGSIAQRHEWLFSATDVFGLGAYDFSIFRAGNVRGFENTIWGHLKGTPFQFADYWNAVEYSEDVPLSFRLSRQNLSVVIVRMNVYVPRVRVEPENVRTWLTDPHDTLDLHFESETFNRRFRTEADDRLFAYKLIVPSMMQWLMAMPSGYGVEFYKSALVVFAPRIDPSETFTMVACAVGIRHRIPKLVWDDYEVSQEDAERYWA